MSIWTCRFPAKALAHSASRTPPSGDGLISSIALFAATIQPLSQPTVIVREPVAPIPYSSEQRITTIGLTAALGASAANIHLLAGYAPPDRLVHSYEIECRGRTGSLVVEQRFDRSKPAMTVTIRSFMPLGANRPVAPTSELNRIFAQMANIQRVEWFCHPGRALLVVDYLEKASIGRATLRQNGRGSRAFTYGKAYLHLDARGLRPEAQPAVASPAR